jgi:hypothetical protein
MQPKWQWSSEFTLTNPSTRRAKTHARDGRRYGVSNERMNKSVPGQWSSESAATTNCSVASAQYAAWQVSSRQEPQPWCGTSGIVRLAALFSGIYGGTRFSAARLRQPRWRARSCTGVAAPSGEAVRGHGTPQLCHHVVASLHNMPLVPTAHPLTRMGGRANGAAPAQRRRSA